MIITCEECQASFNLDENLLKPAGSKVRCSKCNKVFVAYPPGPPKETEKEDAEMTAAVTEAPAEDIDPSPESKLEPGLEAVDEDALGSLDFDLDAEPDKDEAVEAGEAEAVAEESDELDLSELEAMLGDEAVADVAEDAEEDLDLELDLEPEKDEKAEAVAATEPETEVPETDELDLSDLEAALDEPDTQEMTEESIEELDLELELDSEVSEVVEAGEAEAVTEESDELDLSELEEMLGDEAVADVAEDAEEDLDLELALDSEPDATVEAVESEEKLEEGTPDELDLSEIEQALDSDDLEIEIEEEIEEVELELSTETPELEKIAGEDDDDIISEELEDVDLSDIEKMLEVEDETEVERDEIEFEGLDDIDELADSEDIPESDETERIELLLEDSETEGPVADKIEAEEELEATDPFYVETQIIDKTTEELITPTAEAATESEVKAKPVAKKRVSKPVLALVILLLLGGAGLGTVFLLNHLNIPIPLVGDFFKPNVSDPSGNLKIGTLNIQSKFVDNTTSGKLLVITGQVKNEYSNARNFIRVTGRLYASGKKLASTATVFCGNVLSDNELKGLSIAAIKQRLANRAGDNNSNTQVKPGQQLPFMMVFAKLPENLEEFEIEVAGSSAKQ